MAKKGLGRGLGALIPNLGAQPQPLMAEPTSGEGLLDIELNRIDPSPDQPRKYFKDESIQELVVSIREFGVVQPVIVRPRNGRFELVAGERRWRAAKEAGLHKIQALVQEYSDKDALQVGLIENIQREDLNAIEEAEAYRSLISEHQISQGDLAKHLGKSRSAIANTLRLLSLPVEIRQDVIEGHMTSGHARALLSLPDVSSQLEFSRRIREERLSVREVEQLVGHVAPRKNHVKPKYAAPPALTEVAKELQMHMKLPISVGVSGTKGFVKMTFASADEFSRVVEILRSASTISASQPANGSVDG